MQTKQKHPNSDDILYGRSHIPKLLQTLKASTFYFIAVDNGSFPGVKRRGVTLTTPPSSSADVANGWELYLRLPSVSAQACHGVIFTFTLPILYDESCLPQIGDVFFHYMR
jgi:hypothetical protein